MARYPTLDEIQEQSESHGGYCLHCQDWTHDCCEPDARKYTCPECELPQVYGAEELVVMGLVSIEDSEDDPCDDIEIIDEDIDFGTSDENTDNTGYEQTR